jgi:hypothetical protein
MMIGIGRLLFVALPGLPSQAIAKTNLPRFILNLYISIAPNPSTITSN